MYKHKKCENIISETDSSLGKKEDNIDAAGVLGLSACVATGAFLGWLATRGTIWLYTEGPFGSPTAAYWFGDMDSWYESNYWPRELTETLGAIGGGVAGAIAYSALKSD